MYFYGACFGNGVGIGVVIEIPNSKMKLHSYKLEFESTNHEAEYEALIQGLELAKDVNIECLFVFEDSNLVVNQVKNKYGIKKC